MVEEVIIRWADDRTGTDDEVSARLWVKLWLGASKHRSHTGSSDSGTDDDRSGSRTAHREHGRHTVDADGRALRVAEVAGIEMGDEVGGAEDDRLARYEAEEVLTVNGRCCCWSSNLAFFLLAAGAFVRAWLGLVTWCGYPSEDPPEIECRFWPFFARTYAPSSSVPTEVPGWGPPPPPMGTSSSLPSEADMDGGGESDPPWKWGDGNSLFENVGEGSEVDEVEMDADLDGRVERERL